MAQNSDSNKKDFLLHLLQQGSIDESDITVEGDMMTIKLNSSAQSSPYYKILADFDEQVRLIHAIEELALNGLIMHRYDISFIWYLVERQQLLMVNRQPLTVRAFRKIVCQSMISTDFIPAEKTLRNDLFKCSQSGKFHKIDNRSSRNDAHFSLLADAFYRIFLRGKSSGIVREL